MRLIPPLAVILAASGLIFLSRYSVGGTGGEPFFVDILAQIAFWLGAAWLVRRAIGAVLNLYSVRRMRPEGTPHFLETGRHLLTDLVGLVAFGLAILGIVGIVLYQPITGLLATSGLVAPRRIERQLDLPKVLSRVPLLSLLEAEQIACLARLGQLHELSAGAVVVREGDPGASL